jgi:hypothetical protein
MKLGQLANQGPGITDEPLAESSAEIAAVLTTEWMQSIVASSSD